MIDEQLYLLSKIYSISAIDDMIFELVNDNNDITRPKEIIGQLSQSQIKQLLETYLHTIDFLLDNILKPHVDYYEVYYKKTESIEDFLNIYTEVIPMFVLRIINENKNRIFLMSGCLDIIDTENNISCFLDNLVFDKMDNWKIKSEPEFEKHYNKNLYVKLSKIKKDAREKIENILKSKNFNSKKINELCKDILENKKILDIFDPSDPINTEITKIINHREFLINKLFSQRFSDFDKNKKTFLENPETTLIDIFTVLKYTFDLDVSILEFFTEKKD